MKRYDGTVVRWENIQVPAGVYTAAVIEAELLYVKVLREGRTPDEGSSRIVAELAEVR